MSRLWIGLFLLAALSNVSPAWSMGPELLPRGFHTPIGSGGLDQKRFSEAVLILSNSARRQDGLPPLKDDDRLVRAAATHAANMAKLGELSHVLPVRGNSDLSQRLRKQSVRYGTAAENIMLEKVYRLVGRPISASSRGCSFVYGDTGKPVPVHSYASLAVAAVKRWLASPKHRASLLSKRFTRMGSGAGIDPHGPACGDLYIVQTFTD